MGTTKQKIDTIAATLRDEHRKALDATAKSKERPLGLKKQTIDDFAAGHADGVRNTIAALQAQGLLVVKE